MAVVKTLIGNVKGPKGYTGAKGDKGDKGDIGATGQRGSRWTQGTKITGTSTKATIFSNSGISDALVNDNYLNTSTGNTYRCTVAGDASTAKWVYSGNIKGPKGNAGEKGDKGDTGATGPQGPQGEYAAVDSALSKTSTNPIQNKAVAEEFEKKLNSDGDSKDLTATFTSNDSTNVTEWTDVGLLTSGEKHSSLFQKIATMFKNIRYLYHMLGTADISTLGEGANIGTVTGAISKLNSDMMYSEKVTYQLIKSYRRVAIGDGNVVQINDQHGIEGGIIIEIPFPVKYVKFYLSTSCDKPIYCQYGSCTEDAILPNVLTTGEGRITFQVSETVGECEFYIEGLPDRYFFIAGNNFIIQNLRCIMY